jgi:hypothetical protein
MDNYFDFDIYLSENHDEKTLYTEKNIENHNFLVIVNNKDFDEEVKNFLEKIFASISVDLNKECWLIKADESKKFRFGEISSSGLPKYIISFGIDPANYETQAELKTRNWNNFETFSVLIFENLRPIMNNIELKRILWENLKMIEK